jgi:hypothetical protein
VVDVAHDRHDRRTGGQLRAVLLGPEHRLAIAVLGAARLDELLLAGSLGRRPLGGAALGGLEAELAGDERRGVEVDRLVDGREDPVADQDVDDLGVADAEDLGKVLDDDRVRELDRPGWTARGSLGGDGSRAGPRALALRSWTAARSVSIWWDGSPRIRALQAQALHRAPS